MVKESVLPTSVLQGDSGHPSCPPSQEHQQGLNTVEGESFTQIMQPRAKQINNQTTNTQTGKGGGTSTKRCHNILSKISSFEQRNYDAGKKGKNASPILP